ncbi:MAG: hypothetical protein KDC46_01935 [Thermoleophilia bacterium]|nr:hypothetical protein [Thermoleophilia bacterium]
MPPTTTPTPCSDERRLDRHASRRSCALTHNAIQGRFRQIDPLPGQDGIRDTAYSYAANDPVNRVDPLGLTCTTANTLTTAYRLPFGTRAGPDLFRDGVVHRGYMVDFAMLCDSFKARRIWVEVHTKRFSLSGFYWKLWKRRSVGRFKAKRLIKSNYHLFDNETYRDKKARLKWRTSGAGTYYSTFSSTLD